MKLAFMSGFIALLGIVASPVAEGAPADPSVIPQSSPGFRFALDPLADAALIGGSLALFGGSLYLESKKPMPDKAAADPSTIPFFDRIYPSNPSSTLSTVGDDLAIASAALPLVLLFGRSGEEILTLSVMYIETLGLAYGFDSLLKSAVVRYRPYAYSSSTPADFSNSEITASFPSSHATLAFSAAVFTGYVFDELNPDSNMKVWVWTAGLGVAAVVSTLRVASGDHFVSDVVAGSLIGAASGFLVPFLHERLHAAKTKSSDAVSGVELGWTAGGIAVRLSLRP
jgi:membrane-associated phospholipid phosphatase